MSKFFKASVIENRKLIEDHFLLTLQPDQEIIKPVPGNFFMLSAGSGRDPLLKRPFSIHKYADGTLQFLYRVVGRGTDRISSLSAGDSIEVVGPLGNGFPNRTKSRDIILVAGGLGIAPIYYLAEKLRKKKPLLFYGAKSQDNVLLTDELQSLDIKIIFSTDDGSLGYKGDSVASLKKYAARESLSFDRHTIFACGPEQMLKSLSAFSSKMNTACYAAFEQNMACGVGTCLGCVVKTKGGYQRVCKEGPVFPIEEILW